MTLDNYKAAIEYDSGEFNLHVEPELHHELADRAAVEGKSLNEWVVDRLEQVVG